MPLPAGKAAMSLRQASRPPAEAPIPTTVKSAGSQEGLGDAFLADTPVFNDRERAVPARGGSLPGILGCTRVVASWQEATCYSSTQWPLTGHQMDSRLRNPPHDTDQDQQSNCA